MKKNLIISLLLNIFIINPCFAKTVEYTLDVDYKEVNFSGKTVKGLAINGTIPAPTIKAHVGDTLKIKVNNHLKEDTSIHWHGVLLPNDQDGVPYVNMMPIKPGESFTYEYKVTHHGTYWYHSHSGPQEQQGIYGSMIFHPKKEIHKYDEDHIVVLSDWTDENPDHVLANLKRDSDYYALKKDAVQSWAKVLANGFEAIKLRLTNAKNQMGPMDLSDIGYDAFLINGKQQSSLSNAKPGSKVRLRIINAGASSYFNIEFAGGLMKVIAVDGVDITPFDAKRIRIAMAETYDVIVTIPKHKAYEFRATAEDGTGFASTTIGSGVLVAAPTIPKPNLVVMKHSDHNMSGMSGMDMGSMEMGSMEMGSSKMLNIKPTTTNHQGHNMTIKEEKMDMSGHDIKNMNASSSMKMDHKAMNNMNMSKPSNISANNSNNPYKVRNASDNDNMPIDHSKMTMEDMDMSATNSHANHNKENTYVEYLTNYQPLKAITKTTLPKNNPIHEVVLNLTGTMERYVWSINNKIMSESDSIVIKKGENVRFILVNKTMMNHPIHIHGHFFRVLNGQGDYSPLKHTVNVAPYETVKIEFLANEEKDWIFHCHNLYHMKLGMGGIIHYDGSPENEHLKDARHKAEHGNKWFSMAELNAYSNLTENLFKFTNNNDDLILDYKDNYKGDYETNVIYEHYVSQFLGVYAGGNFEREDKDTTNRAILGLHYTLPFLIEADFRVPTEGKATLGLSSKLQLTDRTFFGWEWKTDKTYMFNFDYEVTKNFYIATNYDSKERFGVGISLKF